MDIEISFDGKVLRTPIYIKMDAYDQLVLMCSQLGIVGYHRDVWLGRKLEMETEKAKPEQQIKDAPVLSVKQVRTMREAILTKFGTNLL